MRKPIFCATNLTVFTVSRVKDQWVCVTTAELDSAGNMMKKAEKIRMRVRCKRQVFLSPGTSWKVGVAWWRLEPEQNLQGPRLGDPRELPAASGGWPQTPTAETPWTSDLSPPQEESPPDPPEGQNRGQKGHCWSNTWTETCLLFTRP